MMRGDVFIKRIITAILLAAYIIMAFAACGGNSAPGDVQVLPAVGEGETVVTMLVTMPDGTQTSRQVRTDKKTLGEALREANLIVCDDAGFVSAVDGVMADYSVDQSYWAFYIGGEYATHGVDDEVIADGNAYAFEYAKG